MPIPRWLLLTHQLPAHPSNVRVKVWRKLQDLGAIAVKNSIYVLPNRTGTHEDFDWLRKEIVQVGGEASLFVADTVSDMDDKDIVQLFRAARAKELDTLIQSASAIREKIESALNGSHLDKDRLNRLEREWTAHQIQWERLQKIDFFVAPNREAAKSAVAAVKSLLEKAKTLSERRRPSPPPFLDAKTLQGRTWVTRASPHIDRIACAWLIRRFVDRRARFKFVKEPYRPKKGELRFDMADGEFTHFGDWCSFETFIHRLRLESTALREIAEIVHDIDLKDKKFGRLEASGLATLIRGLCREHAGDKKRLELGEVFFDALYSALSPKADD
jgi:hypothetical protein